MGGSVNPEQDENNALPGTVHREVIAAAETIRQAQEKLASAEDAETQQIYAEIIQSALSKGDLVTDRATLALDAFNTVDASITHSKQGATSEINTYNARERITAYNARCLEIVSYNKSDATLVESPQVVASMNEAVDAVFKGELTPAEATALTAASDKIQYCAKDGVFDPAETLEIQNLFALAKKEGERGV